MAKNAVFSLLWYSAHLTHDLSQNEKNKNVVKVNQMHKMTYILLKLVKVVISTKLERFLPKNQHT